MTTADPLSLSAGEAARRQRRHDPAARHAPGRPRDPDRGLPPPRRRRTRPTSSSRSRAASGSGRYSFLGVGPRRLLEVRDGRRPDPDPARHGPDLQPGPAGRHRRRRRTRSTRSARFVPRRRVAADRGHAAVHRRRRRGARLRRGLGVRADRPAPGARPGRRPDRRLHRDRPRPRLRPPDPHAVGDRLAAHRDARPRGPLPDRRGGDLRGARADRPGRARRSCAGATRRRTATPRAGRSRDPIETSLGRDEYIHAVEVAKDAIAAGEAIQVVLARRQSFDLPDRSRDRRDRSTGSACTARSAASTRARTCSSSGRRTFEVVGASPGAAAPGRGRQADDPPDRRHAAARRRRTRGRRSSPSSSSATRRSGPST